MASTNVATIFLDRALQLERYTPQVEELFNVQASDRGRPLAHVMHRLADYGDLVADAERVLEKLVPVEREVRGEDGRHYLAQILPYRTLDDRIEGVVVTFVDVTRLKEAQEQTRRSEERYRLLIESVSEYGIFTTGTKGEVTSWNPGARNIIGYEEEEILGRPAADIFTEEDRRAGIPEEELEEAARDGQALNERWHLRKDGSHFWASGVMTALHDEAGALRGFAKVLRDNTQQREAAEALRQSQQQLQDLNATLEERVADRTAQLERRSEQVRELASELVAAEQRERHRIAQLLHDDLQQLLYGIQITTATLRRDVQDGRAETAAQKAVEIHDYLKEAIDKTRNLTVDLSPPVLRGEGLGGALRWLASQMEELHGLHVEVEDGPPLCSMREEMRVLLFQVVRELLFNVVKHAETDHAAVELREANDQLLLRVHDGGQGFDVEAAQQASSSDGGFGLQNMRERLSLFGGTVEIESAPGDGTRVFVTVPVAWGDTSEQELAGTKDTQESSS